jgi:hypothetical protein
MQLRKMTGKESLEPKVLYKNLREDGEQGNDHLRHPWPDHCYPQPIQQLLNRRIIRFSRRDNFLRKQNLYLMLLPLGSGLIREEVIRVLAAC